MTISTASKTDFLWKKLIFGMTETNGEAALGVDGGKGGGNETIASEVPVQGDRIWSVKVPSTPPLATTGVVEYFSSLDMTRDTSVNDGRTWFACRTKDDTSSRMTDWIPPSMDPRYVVEVFKAAAMQPADKLGMSVSGQEWVFDYTAGVLHFPNGKPAGVSSIYIRAHRYKGPKGLFGNGITFREEELTISGLSEPVSSGDYVISNYFARVPQAQTHATFINGIRIHANDYYVGKQPGDVGNDRDLVLKMSIIPYPLENSDVVSAQYGFAE